MRTVCLFVPMLAIFSPWLAASQQTSIAGVSSKDTVVAGYTAHAARSSTQTVRQTRDLAIDRADDGLFYVIAEVNGQPVTFLVDTGATHIVLTGADAARVGMSAGTLADRFQMETAAGGVASRWTVIDHLAVGKKQLRKLRAAVAGDELKVSLLGANALSQFDSVQISQDRLTLN